MKKKIVLSFLILISVYININAQTRAIDSVENVLQKHLDEDTVRVDLLNELSSYFLHIDNEKCFKYAREAETISKNNNYNEGLALSFWNIARYYNFKPNYNNAIEYFNKSIEISKIIKNKILIAQNYKSLSQIYSAQAYYPLAIEYLNKALIILEKDTLNPILKSNCYTRYGIIYHELNEYEKALNFYNKSIKIRKKINNKIGIANNYMNIANLYLVKKEYSMALNYYNKSLKIHTKFDNKKGIVSCLSNMASTYSNLEDNNKALEYSYKALEMCDKYSFKISENILFINMTDIFIENKNYKKALIFTKKSIKLANALNLLSYKQEIYRQISEISSATNNYKEAYKNYVLFTQFKDSIFNENNIKKIKSIELKQKYEKEKQIIALAQQKNKTVLNEKMKRQKQQKNIFFITSVLIFIFSIYIYNSLRLKRIDNINLLKQKIEIQDKNISIFAQNEEISTQNEEIVANNEALYDNKKELENTIENLKSTQKQLVQSEKMASLGLLSAGIAHEINNPINFIYAGINSLIKDFKDIRIVIDEIESINIETSNINEKLLFIEKIKKDNYFDEAYKAIYEIIEDVKTGAKRTADIINGLKQFSHTDDAQLKYSDIHEGIDTSLLLLSSKFRNKIEIIKNYDPKIVSFECYSEKLNQAIFNIVSNAIDAIPKTGKIIITTTNNKENIIVSVKDTGTGMTIKTKQKLFDPFYTTKPVGKGTGLGLSMCYGIIEEHRGNIKVLSNLGQGTEFIITLPKS